MNRREFVKTTSVSILGMVAARGLLYSQSDMAPIATPQTKPPKPPPFEAERVKEFVGAGHNNLPRVKEMLSEQPNLLYCTWDWGGGDFETALEGAGHVGDKDIANFLISQGARPNIFVLTMLEKTEIVKGLLVAYPELLHAKGPHGYTLLHHAQRGEKDAAELLAFLQKADLKDARFDLYPK